MIINFKKKIGNKIIFSEDELPKRWNLMDNKTSSMMEKELKREVCKRHALKGQKLIALARMDNRDDFLFNTLHMSDPLHVVHLTWSKESDPTWPMVTAFKDKDDFINNGKGYMTNSRSKLIGIHETNS